MNLNFKNTAYDSLYLESMMSVHALVFSKLFVLKKEYDIFSMIDVYMQHSEIRSRMDVGNWSALNKGWKQIFNSIDFSLCKPKLEDYPVDDILLGWIAHIYVLLQWRYNISSSILNQKLPSKVLCEMYDPLHETSYENACEKLYNKFIVQPLS